jgi:hypothetical protein
MKTLIIRLILPVLILFAAIQVQAADLTFFVGGINPGDLDVSGTKIALDSGPIYGVRLGTKFVPHFGMEHTFSFSSDFLYPQGVSGVTDAKGFIYNSNFIFDIPFHKIVPYVTAGLGLIYQYGSDNLPVGTNFAVNYGGGVKLPKMFGPVGLRFDARGYSVRGVFSTTLNMFEVSGGVLISF